MPKTHIQDTLKRLGRLEELLGRRWDGIKCKKPLSTLIRDGGTAGTGGEGYAMFLSQHWTPNCPLLRQSKKNQLIYKNQFLLTICRRQPQMVKKIQLICKNWFLPTKQPRQLFFLSQS